MSGSVTLMQQLSCTGNLVSRHVGYVKTLWAEYAHMNEHDFARQVLNERTAKVREVKLVENLCLRSPVKRANGQGRLRDEFVMPHAHTINKQYESYWRSQPGRMAKAKSLLEKMAYGKPMTKNERQGCFAEVRWLLQSGHHVHIYHVRDTSKCNHGMMFHDTIELGYYMCRLLGLTDYDAYSVASVTARRLVWDQDLIQEIFEFAPDRSKVVGRLKEIAAEKHYITNVLVNSLLSVDLKEQNVIEPHLVPPPIQYLVEYERCHNEWEPQQTWMIRKSGSFVRQNLEKYENNILRKVTYKPLIEHIEDPSHPWTWTATGNKQTHTCRIIQASDDMSKAMVKVTVIPDLVNVSEQIQKLLRAGKPPKPLH